MPLWTGSVANRCLVLVISYVVIQVGLVAREHEIETIPMLVGFYIFDDMRIVELLYAFQVLSFYMKPRFNIAYEFFLCELFDVLSIL